MCDDPNCHHFRQIDDKQTLEFGSEFAPRFDDKGLITAIAVNADTNAILMVAHMNAEALSATMRTGIATYWSRSRGKLWVKGESSGTKQHLVEMRTDCDQDALILKVRVDGANVACHNGYESCFYRTVEISNDQPQQAALNLDTEMRRADPDALYAR